MKRRGGEMVRRAEKSKGLGVAAGVTLMHMTHVSSTGVSGVESATTSCSMVRLLSEFAFSSTSSTSPDIEVADIETSVAYECIGERVRAR